MNKVKVRRDRERERDRERNGLVTLFYSQRLSTSLQSVTGSCLVVRKCLIMRERLKTTGRRFSFRNTTTRP